MTNFLNSLVQNCYQICFEKCIIISVLNNIEINSHDKY